MGFYDLSKENRTKRVQKIASDVLKDLKSKKYNNILDVFSDEDTYIRKAGYQAIGKIHKKELLEISKIISTLECLMDHLDEKVRQTTVNAAGEIGKTNFKEVRNFFDRGLFDPHHSVRNAVIGSIKKMGEKNPKPVFKWASRYLEHPEKEIRREICHGIELRGRTHPQDILPMLKKLQNDSTKRVQNTLIHVLGQISYKKGCLQTVVEALNSWDNKILVRKALDEIIDVHQRYRNFAVLSQKEAIAFIDATYRYETS
ncbi:MAG: HEAT repeat domain-containing protein [Bacteroidota bacterium]